MKNGNYLCRQRTRGAFSRRVNLNRFAQVALGSTNLAGGPTVNHVQMANGNVAYPSSYNSQTGQVSEWSSLSASDYAAASEARPTADDW